MDLGTLRFSRNGRDLGIAVQGLEGTLYPAFSMYNRYVRQPPRARAKYTISVYDHIIEPHVAMSPPLGQRRWAPTTIDQRLALLNIMLNSSIWSRVISGHVTAFEVRQSR